MHILEGVQRVFRGCEEGVQRVFRRCSEGVRSPRTHSTCTISRGAQGKSEI